LKTSTQCFHYFDCSDSSNDVLFFFSLTF